MRFVHNIIVRVFIKPEEDSLSAKKGLVSLFPFSLEDEKIAVQEQTATGFNERPIKILMATLTKENHTRRFLEHLLQRLNNEQKELLVREAEVRLDSELYFFIRIDKDILLNEQRYFITNSGNCYHIKMAIAAFPAKREAALAVVEKIFAL